MTVSSYIILGLCALIPIIVYFRFVGKLEDIDIYNFTNSITLPPEEIPAPKVFEGSSEMLYLQGLAADAERIHEYSGCPVRLVCSLPEDARPMAYVFIYSRPEIDDKLKGMGVMNDGMLERLRTDGSCEMHNGIRLTDENEVRRMRSVMYASVFFGMDYAIKTEDFSVLADFVDFGSHPVGSDSAYAVHIRRFARRMRSITEDKNRCFMALCLNLEQDYPYARLELEQNDDLNQFTLCFGL